MVGIPSVSRQESNTLHKLVSAHLGLDGQSLLTDYRNLFVLKKMLSLHGNLQSVIFYQFLKPLLFHLLVLLNHLCFSNSSFATSVLSLGSDGVS